MISLFSYTNFYKTQGYRYTGLHPTDCKTFAKFCCEGYENSLPHPVKMGLNLIPLLERVLHPLYVKEPLW